MSSTASLLAFLILIIVLVPLSSDHAPEKRQEESQNKPILGAIINDDSRAGREEKVAMQMAIGEFCANSSHCPTILVSDSQGDPIRTALLARTMIKEKHARGVLLGLETWQNALIVSELGNKFQVPVLSLANEAPIRICQHRPFLVNAARSQHGQMKAVAAIIHSWQWQQVNVIYEDMDSVLTGIIPYLIEAIQEVGSEISSFLPLPPLLSPPQENYCNISSQLESLKKRQCRVYIVHTNSIDLAINIFKEANNLGMIEVDSVWITTTSITNQIDSLNASVISSMQGVLGIKSHIFQSGKRLEDFHSRFMDMYRYQYPHEKHLEPGVFAMQSYDAAWSVALALEENPSWRNQNWTDHGRELLENILNSNFDGLCGSFRFTSNTLTPAHVFDIVNVVGRSYRELGFWSEGLGFSKSIHKVSNHSSSMTILGQVFWPGGPWTVPRGWAVPSSSNPLRIGIPANTTFHEFVKVTGHDTKGNPIVKGFSVDVFESVVEILPYHLPYVFVSFNGSFDSMVQQIQLGVLYFTDPFKYNSLIFDGVVADTAIIANRCNYAEFSQPYADSGLQMLIYFKPKRIKRGWLFTKPFTPLMWVFTVLVNIYNGLIIWWIERDAHPKFREGSFLNQLGTMLSFAFTTLFSQQGAKLSKNSSRIAFIVWLFVAMVITQSFTASLTSLLTLQQMNPTLVDIETLKKNGDKVGCNENSFVIKYLEEVLGFHPKNIRKVKSGDEYPRALQSGEIAAAFLEVPYVKLFLSKFGENFTTSGPTFKVGGFGFAFPKSSPYLPDISQAILEVTEKGRLLELEKKMLSSSNCSLFTSPDDDHKSRLGMDSFYGLYMITAGMSTAGLCVFIFCGNQEEENKDQHPQEIEVLGDHPPLLIEPHRHEYDKPAEYVEENPQPDSQRLDDHEDVNNQGV